MARLIFLPAACKVARVHIGSPRRGGFVARWLPRAAAISCVCGTVAVADPVPPGIDLWYTPDNGTSFVDFSPTPIPGGFFNSGSDPFTAFVPVKGLPLSTTPPGALSPADTIVRRTAPAALACPGSAMVPIEIVALSLVSSQPVTVTYNGGMTPEAWNLRICLSDSPQATGSMTVSQHCAGGGTFESTLMVTPKFTFTRVSDSAVRTLDAATAPMGMPYGAMPLLLTGGHWVHSAAGSFGLLTSAGGVLVDGNCNGLMDAAPLPATSNFFAGIRGVTCSDCGDPPLPQLPGLEEEAKTGDPLAATHFPLPAQQPPATGDDGDGDGVPDALDNCPGIPNPDQANKDGDATGNACDPCPSDPTDTMVEGECIPAMSQWGALAVALLLLTAGSLLLRRSTPVTA